MFIYLTTVFISVICLLFLSLISVVISLLFSTWFCSFKQGIKISVGIEQRNHPRTFTDIEPLMRCHCLLVHKRLAPNLLLHLLPLRYKRNTHRNSELCSYIVKKDLGSSGFKVSIGHPSLPKSLPIGINYQILLLLVIP